MHLIGLILFAMAVGLGALFLLAKAQKENLGKLYSVSGYVVLSVSTLVIIFAIAAGILFACFHHNGGNCGGGKCSKYKMEKCDKGHGSCEMKGHCSSGASCSGNKCSRGGASKCSKGGSCPMMSGHCSGESCSKGGECSMMSGGMMDGHMMKMMHGDSVKVEMKVVK